MISTPLSEILKTTPAHLRKLKEVNILTLKDFIYNFPRTYKDLTLPTKVCEITTDRESVLKGKIISLTGVRSKTGKHLIKAVFADDTARLELVWFNRPHLRNMIRAGDSVVISGKAQFAFGKISMISPDLEPVGDNPVHSGRIVPVYSETNGLSSRWIRTKMFEMLKYVGTITESLDQKTLSDYDLLCLKDSLLQIHFPDSHDALEKAKKRLAFEELFNLQIQALRNKWEWRLAAEKRGMKISVDKDLLLELIDRLPFSLTDAQKKVTVEILNDLKKPYPMMRLLEGDVGSGKTVVAALAAFNTIRNGYQVALMAPTEVLANQHFKNILKLLGPLGVRVDFLAGSMTAKEKKRVIFGLKNRSIDFVVGTHALIQEKVDFGDLGLAIIDEQHRFGVKQRDILASYGTPHVLSLTATPIPRTLAMTIYGDQDLSVIDELPPGRKEIITRVVPEHKRQDAYRWIEDAIRKGRQAYVICPLIDESETIQATSALQEYEKLKKYFPECAVAVLHGKMKQKDKDRTMNHYYRREISILVSTTVIEVGIDVPNANIIIIEGAERFGLAQLHQLRGRVGRGDHQSYCFLFPTTAEDGNSVANNRRLKAMVNHSSGFKLAEIDLTLRGPGEVYGVKQSGIPDLKIATLTDSKLVAAARTAAEGIISREYATSKNM